MNVTPTLFTIATAIIAGTFTALLVPLWNSGARRWGWIDDPGHRKIHADPVPLSGGPAVFSALLLTAGLLGIYLILSSNVPLFTEVNRQFHQRITTFIAIAMGAVTMTALGIFDDRLELRPALKFLGQLLIATGVVAAGIRVRAFEASPAICAGLTVLWILTVTNAFNFVDNMNGLCAGLGAIAAGSIAALALMNGSLIVAFIAAALAGALIGFLPRNYPRASTFLGDSGSHLIGFLLAVLVIEPDLWPSPANSSLRLLSPMLPLSVPLIDLCWVVTLRTCSGKPFYVGDNNHLSHQLVRIGIGRPAAVAALWFAALIAASAALIVR